MTTSDTTLDKTPPKKNENSFLNILFTIIIPVLILNKLSTTLGAKNALIVALLFPLGFGAYDAIKNRKINFIAILGLLNVGFTGGLAIVGATGFWFAIKEALFPALIGLFVWGSSFTQSPFIKTLFFNPQILKLDLLNERLLQNNSATEFERHLKITTWWLSGSFILSSALNFALASYIFKPIDSNLEAEQISILRNEQIAQMTTWSMPVIMVPSMVFLVFIFWYLLRGIKAHTGLSFQELTQT